MAPLAYPIGSLPHTHKASLSADVLMSEAKDGAGSEAPTRGNTGYRPLFGKFKVQGKDFTRQFCHLYAKRLLEMKRMVAARLDLHTSGYADGAVLHENLMSAKADGVSCWIIGTLYKEMKKKPCVLDELDVNAGAVPVMASYTDDDDYLVLEDETGRIQLLPGADAGAALDVKRLVTGVVVAVRCTVGIKGAVVEEVRGWAAGRGEGGRFVCACYERGGGVRVCGCVRVSECACSCRCLKCASKVWVDVCCTAERM